MHKNSRKEAYKNLHSTDSIFTDSGFSLSEEIIKTSWNIEYESKSYFNKRFLRKLKQPHTYMEKFFDWVDKIDSHLENRKDEEKIETINNQFLSEMECKRLNGTYPTYVLDENRGHCTGLTSMYIALAESIGLNNLSFISIPRHSFVRYSKGSFKRNIECTKNGKEYENEYWISHKKLKKKKDLVKRDIKIERDPRSILASLYHNAHFKFFIKGHLAEKYLKKGLDIDPDNFSLKKDLVSKLYTNEKYEECLDVLNELKKYPIEVKGISRFEKKVNKKIKKKNKKSWLPWKKK